MRSYRFSQLFLNSILVLSLALAGLLAKAEVVRAAPTELFFSEYIEGSSNNKALEIYNGTGASIDLAAGGYNVQMAFNGNPLPTLTINLTGTVADGDVFVLAQSSASAPILAQADQTNGAGWFNGDDAVILRKGVTIIDVIGQIGFDPGTEWGTGLPSTADNTLRRLPSICQGDPDSLNDFDPSLEWDGFATDTFDGLGAHAANCDGTAADPLINEFVFNHVGTDTNEYVEIFGDPNTDYSALTILQIEGDTTGAGTIDSVHTVGTTDSNGFWTTGFLNGAFENGTVTLLLVEDFTGAQGNGLDTDNDGVLDFMPWTRVVDDVAVFDGGAGDRVYSSTVLAPGFSGNPFTPGGASRIPNGADTDNVADWTQNDFDGVGLPGFTGTPDAGEALNTPGAENALVPTGPATNVIINEVDSDTPSTDALEFVELYDGGNGNTSLDGLVVVFYNGSNDLSYAAFDLDGHSTDANGYFILGNTGVIPTPSIIFAGNLLQNGADAVALFTGNASDFPINTPVTTNNLVDAIVYDTDDPDDTALLVLINSNQPQVNEGGGGDSANHSNQRCPDGEGGARNTDTYIQASPTPGAANACDDGGLEIGMCGDPATFIHAIQGSGLTSPVVGSTVIIEGVVVGDFQNNVQPDNGDLNGFYVQEEDGEADADSLTSEGIFVFAPSAADVSIGNKVRVLGEVVEFSTSGGSTMTELGNIGGLLPCEALAPLPAPTPVTFPVTSLGDFERYEGMLVTFTQALVISEYFNYERFGEMVLALPLDGETRPFTPTAIDEPGAPAQARALANSLRRITLDDGLSTQNPDNVRHPNGSNFALDNRFRGGDIIQNATGVIDQTFGLYRIQPTGPADYTSVNPRPAEPEGVGGSLKVASFNVLNYFTTIDDGVNDICGPQENQECRGADDAEELTRQRAKIIAALAAIDADVVGLIEIENHPGDVPTADLVSGLNDMMGAGTYDYIATGAIGTDAIRVAFIYKPTSVTPLGAYAVLDTSVDPRFLDDFNRPVLAQTFEESSTGGIFTVAVNHLKSKGSDCNTIGDPDLGDGQGNCNLTRLAAAEALVDWLASDPTGSGDADALIIGDLNSYDKEDPIDALLAGGFVDLIFEYQGEFAYSYVFDGQSGYLDHALANPTMAAQVTGATVWHINADEPDLLDYDTTFKPPAQDAIYEPDAYRSSDHDPVIVGLELNGSPVCSAAVPSPESLWPANHKFVSVDILGITDPEGDPITITVDSIFQDEAVDAPDSGNTAPDGRGLGTPTAEVRAERVGTDNGRVYHISFTARDNQGGSCSAEVLVGVPISQNGSPAFDDGALFDSTILP